MMTKNSSRPRRFEKAILFRGYHYHRRHIEGVSEPFMPRASVDKGYYHLMIREAGDRFWLRMLAKWKYLVARLTGWYWWDADADADKDTGTPPERDSEG